MKNFFRTLSILMIAAFLSGAVISCDKKDDSVQEIVIPSGETIYSGKTVTYPVVDPSDIYESEKTTYSTKYDEQTKTAVLTIYNADFLTGMPELGAMIFPDLEWTTNDSDYISFNKADLIPEIAGRPFPMFPISEVKGKEFPGDKIEISFICAYRGVPYQVIFTGSKSE